MKRDLNQNSEAELTCFNNDLYINRTSNWTVSCFLGYKNAYLGPLNPISVPSAPLSFNTTTLSRRCFKSEISAATKKKKKKKIMKSNYTKTKVESTINNISKDKTNQPSK